MIVDNFGKGEKSRPKTTGRFPEKDVRILAETCRRSFGFIYVSYGESIKFLPLHSIYNTII